MSVRLLLLTARIVCLGLVVAGSGLSASGCEEDAGASALSGPSGGEETEAGPGAPDAGGRGAQDVEATADARVGLDADVEETAPGTGTADTHSDSAEIADAVAELDGTTDAGPDAASDAGPDAAEDATPDVEPDVPAELAPDTDPVPDANAVPDSDPMPDADAQTDGGPVDAEQDAPPPADAGKDTGIPSDPDAFLAMLDAEGYLPPHPPTVDLDATLAPAGALKSPPAYSGGFVDVSGLLASANLAIATGAPLKVPYGSSPLVFDVDADGDLDIAWVDGVNQLTLMLRQGPWSFTVQPIAKIDGGAHGLAAVEIDGDDTPELVVLSDAVQVFDRKQDGSWSAISKWIGLPLKTSPATNQSAIAADIDSDGLLDLVVSRFQCNAQTKAQSSLDVWQQLGNGNFVDISGSMGLVAAGVAWVAIEFDADGDGDLDLLVPTESCAPQAGSQAFRRRPIGTKPIFELMQWKVPFIANGPQVGSPMGAAIGDVNGDGVDDLVLGEIELRDCVAASCIKPPLKIDDPLLPYSVSTILLLSQPGGGHASVGLQAGLWAPLNAAGDWMTGWSPAIFDFDHDGHADILLAHGYEYGEWLMQALTGPRPVLWRNDGTQQFVDISAKVGLPSEHASRSLALGDLDDDGDLDLVLGGQAVAPRLLRNDLKHGGKTLTVRLRGKASNRWGLGARLALKTPTRTLHATMSVQGWQQTMAVPEVWFALRPGETAQSLTVQWPTGYAQTLTPPAKGFVWQIQEPALFSLSTRYSPAGATPVTIQVTHIGSNGAPLADGTTCSVELTPGSAGAFSGPTQCDGATCTRTWQGLPGDQAGQQATLILGCGGKPWAIRPRIDL